VDRQNMSCMSGDAVIEVKTCHSAFSEIPPLLLCEVDPIFLIRLQDLVVNVKSNLSRYRLPFTLTPRPSSSIPFIFAQSSIHLVHYT